MRRSGSSCGDYLRELFGTGADRHRGLLCHVGNDGGAHDDDVGAQAAARGGIRIEGFGSVIVPAAAAVDAGSGRYGGSRRLASHH